MGKVIELAEVRARLERRREGDDADFGFQLPFAADYAATLLRYALIDIDMVPAIKEAAGLVRLALSLLDNALPAPNRER